MVSVRLATTFCVVWLLAWHCLPVNDTWVGRVTWGLGVVLTSMRTPWKTWGSFVHPALWPGGHWHGPAGHCGNRGACAGHANCHGTAVGGAT